MLSVGSDMSRTLYESIRQGDGLALDHMIEHDDIFDLNWADADNNETCLFAAVRHSMSEVVDSLISLGADVNHKNNVGETALHAAAEIGKPGIIEKIVRAGADVNAKDTYDGKSPLWLAASSGHVSAVSTLLALGSDPSASERMHRRTPLHEVLRRRKLYKMFKVKHTLSEAVNGTNTIESGSNNSLNNTNEVINNEDVWMQCIRKLIDSGAALEEKDLEGKTPLQFARAAQAAESHSEKGTNSGRVGERRWSEVISLLVQSVNNSNIEYTTHDQCDKSKENSRKERNGRDCRMSADVHTEANDVDYIVSRSANESLSKQSRADVDEEVNRLKNEIKSLHSNLETSKSKISILTSCLQQMADEKGIIMGDLADTQQELVHTKTIVNNLKVANRSLETDCEKLNERLLKTNLSIQSLEQDKLDSLHEERKLLGAIVLVGAAGLIVYKLVTRITT
eukprot:CFRG4445T1